MNDIKYVYYDGDEADYYVDEVRRRISRRGE